MRVLPQPLCTSCYILGQGFRTFVLMVMGWGWLPWYVLVISFKFSPAKWTCHHPIPRALSEPPLPQLKELLSSMLCIWALEHVCVDKQKICLQK